MAFIDRGSLRAVSVGVWWTSHQAQGATRVSRGWCSEASVRNMLPTYRKAVANIFVNEILWFHFIWKVSIFLSVKLLDDYDNEEAWITAVNKRKFLFDRILKEYDPPELSGPEDEDDGDDTQTEKQQQAVCNDKMCWLYSFIFSDVYFGNYWIDQRRNDVLLISIPCLTPYRYLLQPGDLRHSSGLATCPSFSLFGREGGIKIYILYCIPKEILIICW